MTKPTEASKSQKNDSKFSTKTKTMTIPIQNLFRYSSRDNAAQISQYMFVFDPKDLKREHYNYGSANKQILKTKLEMIS